MAAIEGVVAYQVGFHCTNYLRTGNVCGLEMFAIVMTWECLEIFAIFMNNHIL